MSIEPAPTPEEAAAIVAALEALRGEPEEAPSPNASSLRRSRWRLAGLLGHPPPREMSLEGSLWSYSSWEGVR